MTDRPTPVRYANSSAARPKIVSSLTIPVSLSRNSIAFDFESSEASDSFCIYRIERFCRQRKLAIRWARFFFYSILRRR